MNDLRNLSVSALVSSINRKLGETSVRESDLNDFAKIAVYHSLKDGQITPAVILHGKLKRTDNREGILNYLQKYGNLGMKKDKDSKALVLRFVNKNDCKYSNAEEQAQSLAFANDTYETLPEIWEAFPSVEKELKDYNFHARLAAMVKTMRETVAGGKQVVTSNDEEAALYNSILAMFPAQA